MATFRFVDLFAGVGGFHHALSSPEFGGECVLGVELDPDAQAVYRRTFPTTPLVGDIRSLTRDGSGQDRSVRALRARVPDHDVLCAGFPCQPFSKSGAQLGLRDATRGTLFFDILQIVRARRPRFLILENVRNLAGPRHRDTWATVIGSIRQEGYRVSGTPVVFSPHNLPPDLGGTPQVRDRVFILAERADEGDPSDAGVVLENVAVAGWDPERWRVEDFMDADASIREIERYRLRPEEQAWLDAWAAFVDGLPDESLPGFPIWVDAFHETPRLLPRTPEWKARFLVKNSAFYCRHQRFIDRWLSRSWISGRSYRVGDFPPTRRMFEWQARSWQPRRADRDLWELLIHFRPSGIRVKAPTYVPALVAITQTSVVGARRRRLTPVETSRLQGFPDTLYADGIVPDKVAYKQMGNAVNVGAVRWVARALFASAGLPWGRGRFARAEQGTQGTFRWAAAAS